MPTLTSTETDTRTETRNRTTPRKPLRVFSILAGLTALAVLLQGLWAGMFLQGDTRPDSIVKIHDMGAWVAIGLAVLTFGWTLLRLRSRRDLLVGSGLLVVLLAAEGHIGGLITDGGQDQLTIIHVPLAMALMGLCVWLPLRARRR